MTVFQNSYANPGSITWTPTREVQARLASIPAQDRAVLEYHINRQLEQLAFILEGALHLNPATTELLLNDLGSALTEVAQRGLIRHKS